MITDRKATLRPILESFHGIHLTAYLVNRGDLLHIKSQLRLTLEEARGWLHSVQTTEECRKFLEPLEALLNDARIFKGMKGNIGLFRTQDSFRILNVPVELERQCHVASSFHVKPILRWMQADREFLLLGLSPDSAHLYSGSRTSIQKVDSILFPESFRQQEALGDYLSLKKSRQLRLKQDETFTWLSDWLEQMTPKSTPKLFLAGEKTLLAGLLKNLKYKNVIWQPVASAFAEHNLAGICANIRKILVGEAKKSLEQALFEFRFAEEMNLTKRDVFQIAKAAVEGRVKRLIVADGMSVFGKIDRETGKLAIHPFDLDHEDDDILDDLAQIVLSSGGEVVIAAKNEIPNGRPLLAILEHQGIGLEKTDELKDYELLQERASL